MYSFCAQIPNMFLSYTAPLPTIIHTLHPSAWTMSSSISRSISATDRYLPTKHMLATHRTDVIFLQQTYFSIFIPHLLFLAPSQQWIITRSLNLRWSQMVSNLCII